MAGSLNAILAQLQSPDENDRRQAIVELLRSGDPQTAGLLEKLATQDPSVEIRYYARRALDSIQQGGSRPTASPPPPEMSLAELMTSADPAWRFAGLKRAVQAPTPENLDLIRGGLARESLGLLKASFVMALGRVGRPSDIPVLAGFVQHEDPRVRANAVEALAAIGGQEAYLHLIPLMQDPDNRVKANVIAALKSFGGTALLELLRKMAFESEVWMRDSALYALSCFAHPQAQAMLGRMAAQDPLARLRDKARQHLTAQAAKGQAVAAEILHRLDARPETTSPPGIPAVPTVRVDAPEELRRASGPPLPPEPQAGVSGSIPPAAAPETGAPSAPPVPSPEPGEEKIGEGLEQLLDNPDPGKRQLALLKMGLKPDAADLPLLLAAIRREQEPFLLASLITHLKGHRGPDVFAAVLPFISHPDDRVRANASEALALIDSPAAVSHLRSLLKDPNNRVRANTILALGLAAAIEPLAAVAEMCDDPREIFRRSGLYIIASLVRAEFLPLLRKLRDDPSHRVRNLAYEVILDYFRAGTPGAAELKGQVDERIRLENDREHFFDNAFDQMFSGILQTISSGKSPEHRDGPTGAGPSPEKERRAFLNLGRKAVPSGHFPGSLMGRLTKVREEISRLEGMIEARPPVGEAGGAGLPEQVREVSETELLRLELGRARQREEAVLIEAGSLVFDRAADLPPAARTALEPELGGVGASLYEAVPTGEFSVLPPPDAGIPEIFDLTMRIYQKHVIAFSFVTGAILVGAAFLAFAALFFGGVCKGIHPVLGAVALVPVVPAILVIFLGAYAFWKAILTLMIQRYVAGRPAPLMELGSRAYGMTWPLTKVMIWKYLYIGGFAILGFTFSMPLFGLDGLSSNLYLKALVRLGGLLVLVLVTSARFFPYWLVEPGFVLNGGRPDRDPFAEALVAFSRDRLQTVLLYLFASLMMSLVSSTTVELFVFLIIIPTGKQVLMAVAVLSEIFLMPLVFSNAVVLSLIFRRSLKRPAV